MTVDEDPESNLDYLAIESRRFDLKMTDSISVDSVGDTGLRVVVPQERISGRGFFLHWYDLEKLIGLLEANKNLERSVFAINCKDGNPS